ncbi:hypothetical protein IT408_00625 [Candidatus Uhrbacteria bacterium]|nr:hypothetical protein [Candidatus Uhrbacteria bacterium]
MSQIKRNGKDGRSASGVNQSVGIKKNCKMNERRKQEPTEKTYDTTETGLNQD